MIDATLLDGLALQVNTIRGWERQGTTRDRNDVGWERRGLGTVELLRSKQRQVAPSNIPITLILGWKPIRVEGP
ncbi:MAG TPA: hypothetical protein VMW91_09370 [Desulfosporosinus sp.]|nr:hypothetical protein [Desulfosporosinus sp.]